MVSLSKYKKNSRFIIFFLILFMSNLIFGQNTYNGKFGNSKGECIRIENDTISFKLFNNDAFSSYTIGKGLIKFRKSKITIKKILPIIDLTTSLQKKNTDESGIKIFLLDNDGNPFEYANIKIKDSKTGKIYLEGISNDKGAFIIDEFLTEKIENKNVTIYMEYVGFFYEKELVFESRHEYTFKSLINFSFHILKNKINITFKLIENNCLSVKYNKFNTVLELLKNDEVCKTMY